MYDYKPNSNRFKEEQNNALAEKKKVEKIISGTAKRKKKSLGTKFTEVFLSEDAGNVINYIFEDVFVPTVQKLFEDVVINGVKFLFHGKSANKNNSNPVNYVSYRSYSSQDSSNDRFAEPNRVNGRSRSDYNFDYIELKTRGECERVLEAMDNLIDTYKKVSVADMYEMVGLIPRFTDYDYGWKHIGDAKVERSNDGYILVMPPIIPLK